MDAQVIQSGVVPDIRDPEGQLLQEKLPEAQGGKGKLPCMASGKGKKSREKSKTQMQFTLHRVQPPESGKRSPQCEITNTREAVACKGLAQPLRTHDDKQVDLRKNKIGL